MIAVDSFLDEIDLLSRIVMRNTECWDRSLVGQFGLTTSQSYTLEALEECGPVTMNRLAEEMRLHGTTMTRMVDGLVRKELAERTTDPTDRRVVLVYLSPEGRSTVAALRRAKRDFLKTTLGHVSEAELREILAGMRRFSKLAEEIGARCLA